jgi:N-acetylmuramoyl-L-alanine amidase
MGSVMEFTPKYPVVPRYLTKPSKRRSGLLINPAIKFIVAHDTGNPASTASGNVKYYQSSRDSESASAHIFVDDKEIIECIPALTAPPEKAWHVRYGMPTDNRLFGVDANDAAIGVEYCFGGKIDADEAYRRYVWVIALCCHRFSLDPKSSIVGHFFLDPERKTDPLTGLARSRRTYEQLLRDIVSEFEVCTGSAKNSGFTRISGSGKVVSSVRLNVRKGMPSPRGESIRVVNPGTTLEYIAWVDEGVTINGISKWYQDSAGDFFWGGGVVPVS